VTAGGEFLDPADDRRALVRIGCVVVGVPARDEQDRVECGLRSILAAGDSLDPGTRDFVVLAADSCSDVTEQIAGSLAANDSRLRVVSGCWRAAGTARAAAIADGLSSAQAAGLTAADTIWIATTDADTVVGPDWLLRANEGYRCLGALDTTVATSARLSGRAIGGFADTIAALVG
jgi:cellulose synthase/poly-beta-1,6-N-acetylglucosamine synthase-like glycosyltransferase